LLNDEIIFKIIFWIQLVIIIIFNRLLPTLRAKKMGTKLFPDREAIENEGRFLFVFRVISGILLAGVIVVYSFFPALNAQFQLPLPVWLRWLGVSFSVICLLFWIYSQEILSRQWSANVKIQEEHSLITAGPYRVMRHPIYTAMIFWSIGLALFTANVFFIAFIVVMILWTPPRVLKEEQMMISHFGDEYREYMKTTGRYFPKFMRK
jgi:protein-S-isoprenylcysteine O-methyltransferase Ste14